MKLWDLSRYSEKSNIQEAYLRKTNISGRNVSEILAQLLSDHSIQILLHLTWVKTFRPKTNMRLLVAKWWRHKMKSVKLWDLLRYSERTTSKTPTRQKVAIWAIVLEILAQLCCDDSINDLETKIWYHFVSNKGMGMIFSWTCLASVKIASSLRINERGKILYI